MQRSFCAALAAMLSVARGIHSAPAEPVNSYAGAPTPEVLRESAAGKPVYEQHCAECHDNPTGRIPARSFISIIRTPDSIIDTLNRGVMRPMAKGLDAAQIKAVAVFLTGREPGNDPQPDLNANLCKDDGGPMDLGGPGWNGWGRDIENSRFQPAPGIGADDLPKLKVKWAFAYPGIAYGQPVVVGGRVFIETRQGQVFSLDANTGCTHFAYDLGRPIRTAISIGALPKGAKAQFAAYFGDEKGIAHAIDAITGKPLWDTVLDDHPLARISGSPKLYQGRLYFPVSSMEEVAGATAKYACCTFRGSVVALDGATGKIIWQTHAIETKPAPLRVNASGTQMYGPAGVAIWNSPTIDAKRKVLYVGTGDSYTDVPVDSSDSILALDLATGRRKWVSQVRQDDNWLVGCPEQTEGNCPKTLGPDHDFGSSAILHTMANGRQIILAGDKSSTAYGFDPDAKGKILWRRKLAQGSSTGGIVWGPAADASHVYFAVSDSTVKPPFKPGGLWALDPATGDIAWTAPPPAPVCNWGPERCSSAQSSAVTAIPGIVFAGSWDGHLRAYAAADGAKLWDFDAGGTYDAVNGVKAHGGGMDMGGQVVAAGMLFINSGVTPIQRPGNALLALSVDGK